MSKACSEVLEGAQVFRGAVRGLSFFLFKAEENVGFAYWRVLFRLPAIAQDNRSIT